MVEHMNKVCIYTCLMGKYDEIKQPSVIDPDFDYTLFSNSIDAKKVGVWEVRRIEDNMSLVELSRYPKLLPHVFLQDYDYSVYVDANIQIISQDFYEHIKNKIKNGVLFAAVKHPLRIKLYDELRNCYIQNKISFNDYLKEKEKCKAFDKLKYGVFYENSILLRKHNEEVVKEIDKEWWLLFIGNTKRDQLWLCPVLYKSQFYPDFLLREGESMRDCSWLAYHFHSNTDRNRFRRLFRRNIRRLVLLFF